MSVSIYPVPLSGIQETITDAKGDIIAATAADTVARLAVGANDTVLTADSSAATGLKWAAPAGGGKVLQVVSAVISTQSTNSTTTFADSNITLSITPTLATSKVLVMVTAQVSVYRNNTIAGGIIKLMRNSTDIWNASGDASFQTYVLSAGTSGLSMSTYSPVTYLDSPATTSSTTYKIQGKCETYSPTSGASITFQNNSNTSTITLLEIGA